MSNFDFKKEFFQRKLNKGSASVSYLYNIARKFGYHFSKENSKWYVYTNYEWGIKLRFDRELKPIWKEILGNKIDFCVVSDE